MQSLISVCAWCEAVKTPTGWMEASNAFQLMGVPGEISRSEITHGICPACAVQWTKIDKKSFEQACLQETDLSSIVA